MAFNPETSESRKWWINRTTWRVWPLEKAINLLKNEIKTPEDVKTFVEFAKKEFTTLKPLITNWWNSKLPYQEKYKQGLPLYLRYSWVNDMRRARGAFSNVPNIDFWKQVTLPLQPYASSAVSSIGEGNFQAAIRAVQEGKEKQFRIEQEAKELSIAIKLAKDAIETSKHLTKGATTPAIGAIYLKGYLIPALNSLQNVLPKLIFEQSKTVVKNWIDKVKQQINWVNKIIAQSKEEIRKKEEERKRKEEEARKRLEEKKKETERINSIKKSITDFMDTLRRNHFINYSRGVVDKINANIKEASTNWESFKKSLENQYLEDENNIHKQIIQKIQSADLPQSDKNQLTAMENQRHQEVIDWVKKGNAGKIAQQAFDANKKVLDALQKEINDLLVEIDRVKKEDEMVKKQIQDTQKEIQTTQIEIAKIKAQIGG